MVTKVSHDRAVAALRAQLGAQPDGAPIRLAKPTSNLFRFREPPGRDALDVSAFGDVLRVDAESRTADVGGMTTYEELVDATLPHGLMPLVVPQLKTITLGGAVTGLGIESSLVPQRAAARVGAGDGDPHRRRPRSCWRGRTTSTATCSTAFPNSYGTLGYALRLRIELEPVRPYVAAAAHPVHRRRPSAAVAIEEICAVARYEGEPVDFVDGTVFCRRRAVPDAGHVRRPTHRTSSDYTGTRHLLPVDPDAHATDQLTMRDYLWRWDTDWFWCSRALRRAAPAGPPAVAAQVPALRRLPQARRRSTGGTGSAPGSTAARAAAARAGDPGRRGPGRPAGRVPRLLPRRDRRSARCGCARCRLRERRLAALPDGCPDGCTSTSASGRPSRLARARPTARTTG